MAARRTLGFLLLVIGSGATTSVHAQQDPAAASGAWVLTVVSTGGLAGGGLGTFTLTSEGTVACRPAACVTPLSAVQLQKITTALGAIASEDWSPQKRRRLLGAGTCIDCGRTTVTLRRREAQDVRTYDTSWDGLETVAESLRELTRLVFDLRTAPAPR